MAVDEDWVEVLTESGKSLGWLTAHDCEKAGLSPSIVKTQERYLEDPYLLYWSDILFLQGAFTNGQDLNLVQRALLFSHEIRRIRAEADEEEAQMLLNMRINNEELWQQEMRRRERELIVKQEEEVEYRIPRSVEEFMAMAAEVEGDWEDEGISSFLDPEELEQMGD